MGLINQNSESLLGLNVSSLYFCIGNQTIYLRRLKDEKGNIKYVYHTSFEIYASYKEKQAGTPYISTRYMEVVVDNNNLDAYSLLYDTLKNQLVNYVDVL